MAEYDVYQSKFRATEIDDLLTKIQSYDPSALVSPTVKIVESETGSTIIITDKDGDHTTLIKNGAEGPQGDHGQDGTSVTAAIDDTVEGQHTVTLTDKDGEKSFTVKDGTKGDKGDEGSSVTVAIDETVEKEHKVTFTDKDGDKEITIKDGANGKDGKALIDDDAESGSDVSWSVDKIIAYVQKVLEDIENGTY